MSAQVDDTNEIIKAAMEDFQPIIVAQPFSWFEEHFKNLFHFHAMVAVYRPRSTLSIEEKALLELCKDDPWFELYRSYICGGIYPVGEGYLLHLNEHSILVMRDKSGYNRVITQPQCTPDGIYSFGRPKSGYNPDDLIITEIEPYRSYQQFKEAERQYHLFAPTPLKRAS